MSTTQDALTLGVEEEFQIVEAASAELAHGFETLMRGATPEIQQHMKPEFLQCVVECITGICPDVAAVRHETTALRATAAALGRPHGLALVSAGTNPTGRWYDQVRSPGERYDTLEEMLQDVARSILIYGLHVHVGVADEARRVEVVNQARTYLPHILALSVNSPFWMGRYTGFMSYRTIVWAPFPFSGVPEPFASFDDYRRFRDIFAQVNSLNDVRRVWWDIRAHHAQPTVEFRIADMPLHHEDMLGIVAFAQALVKTILRRIDDHQPLPVYPRTYIEENRWRVARWGLRGMMADFEQGREIPIVDAIAAALDLVGDAAAELGTTAHINHLRDMLAPGYLCGAERQIAAYKKRYDARDATRMLMEETMRGIDLKAALPLAALQVPKADGQRKGPFLRMRRPPDAPAQV